MERAPQDVIGILPAAGRGTRMGRLPCSKEILPIGVKNTPTGKRVQVMADLLLKHFSEGNIGRAIIPTDPRKADIEGYLGSEHQGIQIDYVYLESPSTVHSIDACYNLIKGRRVALGFPDILLPACDGFARLLETQRRTGADVTLGLFAAAHPEAMDMVRCDQQGRLLDIAIKQHHLPAGYDATWTLAVWNPRFTEHLHHRLGSLSVASPRELYVGDILLDALQGGLNIHCIELSHQICLDAGTPENYARAFLEITQQS